MNDVQNEKMISQIPQFSDGARVCFLGDSLTSGGIWVELVFEHYLRARPNAGIRVYDAGIGGGTAAFALEHIDEDLMTHDPTDVIIMFGENDISAYVGTPEERAECFRRDMSALADEVIRRGASVYFMCPPDSDAHRGDAVQPREIAHEVMLGLAEQYGTSCCDLYRYLSPYLSHEGLVDGDRVHLTERGQCVLARVFLSLQGFDGFSPDAPDFFDSAVLPYDGDHRMIFNDKIRRIWLAVRNISTGTGSVAERVEWMRGRIPDRAGGAWDEFCYYRAIDFIELFPNMQLYIDEFERTTERMVRDAESAD